MASFSSISCFFKISAPDSGPFSVHFSSTSFSSRISIVGMFTADRGYPRKSVEGHVAQTQRICMWIFADHCNPRGFPLLACSQQIGGTLGKKSKSKRKERSKFKGEKLLFLLLLLLLFFPSLCQAF